MPDSSAVTAITFRCSDPAKLAAFYLEATGAEIVFASDTATYITCSGAVRLGFEKADDHRPAAWSPDTSPTVRLDLTATDLAADEERLIALGATRPGHSFDTDQWIFMRDPEGYAFTLTTVY